MLLLQQRRTLPQRRLRHGILLRRLDEPVRPKVSGSASMAGYSQQARLLRIDTILNGDPAERKFEGDPLLLVKLDGVEGISRLFAYDLVMLRDAGGQQGESVNGEKRPPIDTTRLIGTPATIGARPSNSENQKDDEIFFLRVGMFETFEDILGLDITHFLGIHARDFHVYRARVVPWVKVLSRDICYRVFEQKTVLEIIDAIAEDAKNAFPHLIIDTSGLKDPKFPPFPPIEYCVQYGESTFEFMSRLMARFGIWYFFGHRASGPDFVLNETMILKRNLDASVPTAGLGDVKISDDNPGASEIAKLVRRYRPPERRMVVGGFNYVDPTHPYYKDGTVSPSDDLLKTEGGAPSQTRFSGAVSFAEPVFSDPEAEASAKNVTSRNQSEVRLLSGVSKNHSFVSGHSFRIDKGKDFDPADNEQKPFADIVDHDFVIDLLAVTANDYNYVNLSPNIPIIGETFEAFFHTIAALEADALDYSNNALYKASLWATRTGQAKIYRALNPLYGNFADTAAGTDIDIAGAADTALGALSGSLPGVLGALGNADFKKAIADEKNLATFAVGVIAVPADPPLDPPLPLAVRPVARGPHTAVVIGPDGTDTKKQDVFADAIGRVRVRFPWDPGPPEGGARLPPVFPVAQPDKPTQKGQNTCWVRVVEGWAGRHYGTQFLPRIGQEVIVDFLDGDPERPVITGRLYNADHGFANLPFPQGQVDQQKVEQKDLANAVGFTEYRFTGLRTSSIPKPDEGAKERYHLLRFDDAYNCEQWLLRSQGRLDVTAFAHSFATTYGNRHVKVAEGRDKDDKPFGGSAFTTIGGEYDVHVGGNRYEQVEKNYEITVKGDVQLDLKQNLKAVIAATASIGASSIVIEATNQITLKVGGSWIVIGPSGVYIDGPMVYINSGGAPQSSSAVTMQNVADAEVAEPGDKPNSRVTDCNPQPQGAGQRATHTDWIQPALPCILNDQNQICVDPLAGASSGAGPAGMSSAASHTSRDQMTAVQGNVRHER
jgi:uncharacterized protein involved in type VI secretion and phage assembly